MSVVFRRKHRTLDLKGFLERAELGEFYDDINELGAGTLLEFISISEQDIDELCSSIKMKMFHKIRLKHAIKCFKQMLEKYPLDEVDGLNSLGRRKRRLTDPNDPDTSRSSNPNYVRSAEENDVDQLDFREVLQQMGYLDKNAVPIDSNSSLFELLCEKHRIYGVSDFTQGNLNTYQLAINKCAGVVAYYLPQEVAKGKLSFRSFVEKVLKASDYKFRRRCVKRLSGAQQRKNRKVKLAIAAGLDPSEILHRRPGRPRKNADDVTSALRKQTRTTPLEEFDESSEGSDLSRSRGNSFSRSVRADKRTERELLYDTCNSIVKTSSIISRANKHLVYSIDNNDFEEALRCREAIELAQKELDLLESRRSRLERKVNKEKIAKNN
eukprot:Sdes_comp22396_c0_seq1m20862